jgi:hypothetical protein
VLKGDEDEDADDYGFESYKALSDAEVDELIENDPDDDPLADLWAQEGEEE